MTSDESEQETSFSKSTSSFAQLIWWRSFFEIFSQRLRTSFSLRRWSLKVCTGCRDDLPLVKGRALLLDTRSSKINPTVFPTSRHSGRTMLRKTQVPLAWDKMEALKMITGSLMQVRISRWMWAGIFHRSPSFLLATTTKISTAQTEKVITNCTPISTSLKKAV